jgi:radical SAM superfamily enzyme YgiQ (UPF0313 family)
MGASFRIRSPDNILEEMIECWKEYNIWGFDIEDDNFTFDQERAKQLMNLIIETFGEGNLELSAMNGISFASLDEELLSLMKKAGFRTINLSFVSADPFTKRRMGRPKEVTCFDEILEGAEQVSLQVIAYAILGMLGQTVEEMVDTLIYLMGKKVLIGPSIYYPTPGTPLYKRCRREGVLPLHPSQWRSSALPIETKDFNRLDIVTLFRLARTINFVKGKMDEGELEEGIILEELFQVLKEKKEVKAEIEDKVKVEDEVKFYALCNKDNAITWIDLLLSLFKERSFFSFRKDFGGRTSILKVESSKKVLDCFFERAREKLILKSRYD